MSAFSLLTSKYEVLLLHSLPVIPFRKATSSAVPGSRLSTIETVHLASPTLYPFTIVGKGLVTCLYLFRPRRMQLISSGFTVDQGNESSIIATVADRP